MFKIIEVSRGIQMQSLTDQATRNISGSFASNQMLVHEQFLARHPLKTKHTHKFVELSVWGLECCVAKLFWTILYNKMRWFNWQRHSGTMRESGCLVQRVSVGQRPVGESSWETSSSKRWRCHTVDCPCAAPAKELESALTVHRHSFPGDENPIYRPRLRRFPQPNIG